ncbi:MAG: histidine--tRNA ligase [Candidatus Zambryskibacteria bacterium]|nr:histidine--tRNA ligase [Candidatus Zambryskibacteria bacterium]
MTKISTESYKGVRDFYPEDKFVQNYIFKKIRQSVELFGYVEYDASILESAELYKAKSGEEIVNEQTYTFTDRGDREVTLRPEMTPTIARMIAARQKELVFPLRWYSVPNLFRYEKPQRGRLREHWQLNVDLFGVESNEADTEVISIAHKILRDFGATEDMFVVKINNRKIIDALYEHFALTEDERYRTSKLIDKKNKVTQEVYTQALGEIIGEDKATELERILSSNERLLAHLGLDNAAAKEIVDLIELLSQRGVTNVEFSPTLMRGFDYYTGIVFEVFDTHPDNRRSLFGGGRYNDLLDIFGAQKIPAVGFGMGDVSVKDFLETHSLLPAYTHSAQVHICTLTTLQRPSAFSLADTLRADGLNVSVDISGKKVGDQLKLASKQHIPFVIIIGEDEVKSQIYSIKNLDTGEEQKLKAEEIIQLLSKSHA